MDLEGCILADYRLPESERWDARTETLIGTEALGRLHGANVIVAGLGGVGGYAAEMLVRSGVGELTLVDSDDVAPSNINRQLIADRLTVGQPKAILFARRFHAINPECTINALREYITPDAVENLLDRRCDMLIDAIDTIAPKTALLAYCLRHGIPVISSMGAGARIDPSKVEYRDLWHTADDGLARAVRQRLRKEGLRRKLPVVCSAERPRHGALIEVDSTNKRTSPGTLAPVPATFGIFLAAYAIRKIAQL